MKKEKYVHINLDDGYDMSGAKFSVFKCLCSASYIVHGDCVNRVDVNSDRRKVIASKSGLTDRHVANIIKSLKDDGILIEVDKNVCFINPRVAYVGDPKNWDKAISDADEIIKYKDERGIFKQQTCPSCNSSNISMWCDGEVTCYDCKKHFNFLEQYS